MARPHQVAELLRNGDDLRGIAEKLEISYSSARGYAWRAAEEGLAEYFDVVLALPADERAAILGSRLPRLLGELYSHLWRIETTLHSFVRQHLEQRYGNGERGWWELGIPEDVRVKCQERRERDRSDRLDPYCYTDLLDMWKILDKQWKNFEKYFRAKARDKPNLKSELERLNDIRNWVMHPAKERGPTEDDFVFVRQMDAFVSDVVA